MVFSDLSHRIRHELSGYIQEQGVAVYVNGHDSRFELAQAPGLGEIAMAQLRLIWAGVSLRHLRVMVPSLSPVLASFA